MSVRDYPIPWFLISSVVLGSLGGFATNRAMTWNSDLLAIVGLTLVFAAGLPMGYGFHRDCVSGGRSR